MVQKGGHMSSITIHNLDDDLEKVIREKAELQHTSLNKIIKNVLREAFGLDNKEEKKSDFSDISGTWTDEEAEEFERNTKGFDTIDPGVWK